MYFLFYYCHSHKIYVYVHFLAGERIQQHIAKEPIEYATANESTNTAASNGFSRAATETAQHKHINHGPLDCQSIKPKNIVFCICRRCSPLTLSNESTHNRPKYTRLHSPSILYWQCLYVCRSSDHRMLSFHVDALNSDVTCVASAPQTQSPY